MVVSASPLTTPLTHPTKSLREFAGPGSLGDLFGIGDNQLLDRAAMSTAAPARVGSARRLRDAFDFEIELFTKLTSGRLAKHPRFDAVQTLPRIGPVLGAVLVAEIGDVTWFRGPTYDLVVIARNHDKYPPSPSIET